MSEYTEAEVLNAIKTMGLFRTNYPNREVEKVVLDALNKQNWIPVSERMPEEHKWIGTESFGTTISDEVYVTFETPKGERFVKHLAFQNGGLSRLDQQTIDAFFKGSVLIAWMPLPEPYKG